MPWPQCRFQSFVMHLPQSLVSRPQCHGPSATWPQCHLASVGPSAIAPFESEGHVYHVRGKQTKGSGHRVEPCLHTTLRCWQSCLQHDGRWQMASSRIVTAILGGDCPEARPPSWRRPFACFPGPTPQWRMDLQPTAELADGLPEIVIDQAPVGSQPDWCCPSRHSHDFFVWGACEWIYGAKNKPRIFNAWNFLTKHARAARLPHWVGHFWWGTSVFFEVAQLTTGCKSWPSGVISALNEFIMWLSLSLLSYKSQLNWLVQT